MIPFLKHVDIVGTVPFMSWHRRAMMVSVSVVVLSLVLLPTRGLNFGIDFEGGIVVEAGVGDGGDLSRARSVLGELGLGDLAVQEIGDVSGSSGTVFLIRSEIPDADSLEDAEIVVQEATSSVVEALRQEFGEIDIRRTEAVGPKVSAELLRDGVTAMILALVLMLVYIWFRFEWQFSLGAVLALMHDVILTIGMFAVTQLEFNLNTVAALLTIVGYSMNDTVVVYDRVREELRRYKKLSLRVVIDMALNRTLSRTLLTSGTTLLALLSIFIFGGQVLRGFSFAMIWGVLIGTYSSIFVASSLLLYTGLQREGQQVAESETTS